MKMFKRVIVMILTFCMVVGLITDVSYVSALTAKPADGTTVGQPFASGTGDSTYFRIPAMITTNNGTIVAAADARWNGTNDACGIDTMVSYSTDNGENWTYTYANYLGDNDKKFIKTSATFIDPVLTYDSSDNTIYMVVDLYVSNYAINTAEKKPITGSGFTDAGYLKITKYDATTSAFESDYNYYVKEGKIYHTDGTEDTSYTVDAYFNLVDTSGNMVGNLFFEDSAYQAYPTTYLYMTKSTDEGKTWSEPTLLDVKNDDEYFYGVGPGRGLVTSDGTIMIPCYFYNGGDQRASIIYSTDKGATWTRTANITGTSEWSSESQLVELDDGTIRCFYRNGNSQVCYVDATGNGTTGYTWGSSVKTGLYSCSNTMMSAISYSKTIDGQNAIIISYPASSSSTGNNDRVNGRIAIGLINDDNTMNWKYTYEVNNTYFWYSCLTELDNGDIGLLYETDSNGATIKYTSFDIYSLAKGAAIDGKQYLSLDKGETFETIDTTGDYTNADTTSLDTNIADVQLSVTEGYEVLSSAITSKDDLVEGKEYVIVSERKDLGFADTALTNLTFSGSLTWSPGTTVNGLYIGGKVTADTGLTNSSGEAYSNRWKIVPVGDGTYYVMCGDQYLTFDYSSADVLSTGSLTDTATPLTLEYSNAKWYIKTSSGIYLSNVGGIGNGYYGASGINSTDGSGWYIYSVETTDATKIELTGNNIGTTSVTIGDITYYITVGKEIDVELRIGESVEYADSDDDYSELTLEGLNESIASVDVEPNNNTYNAQLGTDASYSGDKILLDDCAFTFEKQSDGVYKVYAVVGGTTVYLGTRGSSSAGYPVNTTETTLTLTQQTDSSKFTIVDNSTANTHGAYLFFWIDTSKLYFDRNGSAAGDNTAFYILQKSDTTSDDQLIAGYNTVTDITDGEYIIAIQGNDGNYYVVHPTTDTSSKYACVAKVITPVIEEASIITIEGVSPGTTSVEIGNVKYNITVLANEENVVLKVGESVEYTDTTGDYSSDTLERLDTSIATVTVEGESNTYNAQIWDNSSSYNGDYINLEDALYTFTYSSDNSGYTVQNGNYYLHNSGTTPTCPNKTSAYYLIFEDGTNTTNGIKITSSDSRYLHFHTEATTDSGIKWNACKGDNCGAKHEFYIWKQDSTATDTAILGYTMLTKASEIEDGGKYLITAVIGSTYYALYPGENCTSNANHNVAKVITPVTEESTTITIEGVSPGETSVLIGNVQYNITVLDEKGIVVYEGETKELVVEGDYTDSAKEGLDTSIADVTIEIASEATQELSEAITSTDDLVEGKEYVIVSERKDLGFADTALTDLTISYNAYGTSVQGLYTTGEVTANTGLTNSSGEAYSNRWKIVPLEDGTFYIMSGDKYLSLDYNSTAYAGLEETGTPLKMTYNTNGYWYIQNAENEYLSNVGGIGNGFYGVGGFNELGGSGWYIYSIEDVPATTSITFEGIEAGNTSVIIGYTEYNIIVLEKEELTESEKTIVLYEGDTKLIKDYTGDYSNSYNKDNLDENVATVEVTGTTASDSLSEAISSATYAFDYNKEYVFVSERYNGTTIVNAALTDLTISYNAYGTSVQGLYTTGEVTANTGLTNSNNEAYSNRWKIVPLEDGTFYIMSGDKYLSLDYNSTAYASLDETGTPLKMTYNTNGYWYIQNAENEYLSNVGGIGNGFYGVGGFNEFGGSGWKIYAVENLSNTSITINAISEGETSIKVGYVTYNIKVLKPHTEVLTTETTPFLAGTGEGKEVENSDGTTYVGPVTKLNLSVGLTYNLDLNIEGTDIVWSIDDETIATVDQDGNVTGVSEGTTYVNVTVDGVTYSIPVVIVDYAETTNTQRYNLYIAEITDTYVYYSWDTSTDLIQAYEGEVFYVDQDRKDPSCIAFFGMPYDGYALTRMTSTNSDGAYFRLHTGDHQTIDETEAGYLKGILTKNGTEYKGAGIAQTTAFGEDKVRAMVQAAIDLGCDGGMGFTRNNYSPDVNSDLTFRSEKLPTVTKEVAGVLGTSLLTSDYRLYTEGMTATVGEWVYFKITVTKYESQDAIDYSNVTLTEGLEGCEFMERTNDPEDPNHIFGTSIDITSDLMGTDVEDFDANAAATYTYYAQYKITEEDIDNTITNTVELSYQYQSEYSSGTFGGTATAEAKIKAQAFSAKDLVIDFGLPVSVEYDIWGDNIEVLETGSAKYGDVKVEKRYDDDGDHNGWIITYTPTTILLGADVVTLYGYDTEVAQTTEEITYTESSFLVYPATSIYYEEGFSEFSNILNQDPHGWTNTGSKGTDKQQTQTLGAKTNDKTSDPYNYGYDDKYASETTGASNGTQATSTLIGDDASFTFTGTGVDIYANCTSVTGKVSILVKDVTTGKAKKLLVVDTSTGEGSTDATEGQNENSYSLPIASIDLGEHGTYSVTIRHAKSSALTVAEAVINIDGFRVYNTIADSTVYRYDLEDNPEFYELRDMVLYGLDVTNVVTDSQYGSVSEMAGQVYNSISTDTEQPALIIGTATEYPDSSDGLTEEETDKIQDLLDNGPKNELFIHPESTLVFKVTTDRAIQLGMKAPIGETTYTISGTTDEGLTGTITTSTDMFYDLENTTGTETTYTITVTNTGENILSITDLKICDDPNVKFESLNEEDIEKALNALGFIDEIEKLFPFTDVKDYDWYKEYVNEAYQLGLMTGASETLFKPLVSMNRGMVAIVLARMEGGENTPYDATLFPDVKDGEYWAKAVTWAKLNGVINGYGDGTFRPDRLVTREEMAQMIYNFAVYKGIDVDATADLSTFLDSESVSTWHKDAMVWANANGLITGKYEGTQLDPQGTATRAECTKMLVEAYKTIYK